MSLSAVGGDAATKKGEVVMVVVDADRMPQATARRIRLEGTERVVTLVEKRGIAAVAIERDRRSRRRHCWC